MHYFPRKEPHRVTLPMYAVGVLPLINPWRACAARVTVVGLCVLSVCLSVCYSTTVIVRAKNELTYPTADRGQKICGIL